MGKYTPKKEVTKVIALPFTPGKDDTLDGFKDINNSTMAIPFLRILQTGSPQVKKNNEQKIDGAEEGFFFNTVSKKCYGKHVKLIVLRFERIYIEWLPDHGGFIGYHDPEYAEKIATDKTFGKWKHGDNLLQENYVYLVLIDGEESDGPMVLSLASTMIKTAKEWNRLLFTTIIGGQRMLPYYMVWNVSTEYVKKDEYDWYVPKVEFANLISEKQYLSFVTKERKALPSRQIDYAQLEGGKGEEKKTEKGEEKKTEKGEEKKTEKIPF